MPNYPIPPREPERLEALASYNILDTINEQEFDDLVILASEICDTPVSLISLVDGDRQWFKAKVGTDIDQTPRDQSFCAHAIVNPNDILIVNDARLDERFSDNPLVTGDPNIVFYAGVPLVNDEGYALGSLCVIDQKVRNLTENQINALKILSKQALMRFEFKKKVAQLEDANASLLKSNVLIEKFARTAAHDIKNPLSSILISSQLMQKSFEKGNDERNQNLASKNVNACNKLIHMVDEMLSYANSPSKLLSEQKEFDLRDLIRKMLELITQPKKVTVILPENNITLNSSILAFEQIFLNLITNAIRYNDSEEIKIAINFKESEQFYDFEISDNGIGIEENHLSRIFEDNFTVQKLDRLNNKSTGIGLSTVKALIEKLNGSISATSVVGEGTKFIFYIKK